MNKSNLIAFPTQVATRPSSYKSNMARVERLKKWAASRDWDISGRRNQFLCVCGSLIAQAGGDALDELMALNSKLKEPSPTREVECIAKAVGKSRYKWKAKDIVDRLDMTEEEARKFGFSAEAYRNAIWKLIQETGVDTRKPHRTRDMEAAQRKAAKLEKYKKIPQLHAQGKTYNEIATILGISLRTAKAHKNGI